MYNPKHRQTKKATKDNKSSRPPQRVRYEDTVGVAGGLGGGGSTGAGDEFDLGKVLQESWDLERTADDEFLAKHIAFPTPRRQLEQLEYQSNQLNEINTRVSNLLHNFEEQYSKDEAFNLIEESEDPKFFDKKSLLEESKGKVKVLVVDYNKLSLTREAVLTSLREWFDVINNDDISDTEADEDRNITTSDNSFSTLVKGVNKTKDRLAEVHMHLVDYCNEQMKTASQHDEQEEARKAEVEQLHNTVDRLSAQIQEQNIKLRDADARNIALQKTLDRTNEELRFFRISDSSKTGQLKDELFQIQQRAKDRETELTLELDKATKKLAKTQDQLDTFVLSLHQEQQNTAAAIEELTAVSEELRTLKAANAKMLEEAAERASGEAELEDAQDAEKSKELAHVRSRAQEEVMVKLYKMKTEHEEHTRKLLEDNAATIHRMEAQHQEQMEKQTLLFAESMKSKDSKNAMDSIKASYEDKMKKMIENNIAEKEKIKKDHARILAETVKEHQIKLNFQAQQFASQKSAMEHNAHMKRDMGPAIGNSMAVDDANKRIAEVTEMYEQQVMQARIQIRDRDDIISQLKNQLAMVTGLLGKAKASHDPLPSAPATKEKTGMDRTKSVKKTPSSSPQPSRASTALERPASRSTAVQQPTPKKDKPRVIIPKSGNQSSPDSPVQKLKASTKPASPKVEGKPTITDNPDNASKKTEVVSEGKALPSDAKPEIEIKEPEAEERGEQGDVGEIEGEDVASLLRRLEEERRMMDKKLDSMKEKDQEYTQKLERQKSELQKIDLTASVKSGNQAPQQVSTPAKLQNPAAAGLQTPNATTLQTPTAANLQPVASLQFSAARAVSPASQGIADAKVDGYLMDLRAELTTLTKENETLRSQLTSMLEQYAVTTMAPAGQQDIQENPQFTALEERLSALIVENEMLKKGEHLPPPLAAVGDEPGGAPSAEIILKTREAKLTQALQDALDSNAKITMLEDQISNYEKAVQDMETKRTEMEAVIAALTLQVNKHPAMSSQAETQLRADLERTMAQERATLHAQIAALEKQISDDATVSLAGTSELRLVFRKEVESMQSQQDEVIQSITENYEKRIKGLTEALSACLNDTDIAEELRKDAEYKVLAVKLVNEKETSRLQEELRRLAEEHSNEMQNLEKKDKQELQRLRNTLERLQLEFETFLNEDNYSTITTVESMKSSLSRTNSIINARVAKSSVAAHPEISHPSHHGSNLQTGIVGTKFKDLPGGELVSTKTFGSTLRHRSPPRKVSTAPPSSEPAASEGPDSEQKGLAASTDEHKKDTHTTTTTNNSNQITTSPEIKHRNSSPEFRNLEATASLQGVGRAMLRGSYKPPDLRTLMKSMESATNEEINTAINMYQGFKTMVARRKFLQEQRTQEKFVEVQQVQFENSTLKKQLAAARGRIAELERQLLAIKNQNLEHKYRSEIGVTEYKAIINHQETVIDDLRHMYRRNQGALVATQERKSRLEKSVINLHITIADHEKTITTLQQASDEMRVQIEDLKRWQARGGYSVHADDTGPLRIRTMLPGSRGERRAELPPRFQKSVPPNDQQQEALQAEPNTKTDRANLQMMEHLLKAMDDSAMDPETKSTKEATLSLLETDRKMRKQKVGAIFHKLHERFQLKLVRDEIVKTPPEDRLSLALKKMESRHALSLLKWDARREDLVEKRKLHLLQVMRAFSTIMASNQARYETAQLYKSGSLQLNAAPVFPAKKLNESHNTRSHKESLHEPPQIDYTQLFPRNPSPVPLGAPTGSTGNSAHASTVASTRSKLRKQALINPRLEPEVDMVLQTGQKNVGIQGTQMVLGKKKDRPDSAVKFYFNDKPEKNLPATPPEESANQMELSGTTLPIVKRTSGNVVIEYSKPEKVSLPPIVS